MNLAPDTKRKLSVFLVLLLPVCFWLLAIRWLTGLSPSVLRWRDYGQLARITPDSIYLFGPPLAGLFLAIVIMLIVGKRTQVAGFQGAAYRRWVRGTKTTSADNLASQTRERFRKQIEISNIPMPTKCETLHTLFVGATGSGKSAAMEPMIYSALTRGDRLFAVDPNGDLLSKFYRPGDIILNPYDARTLGWSFFNEVRAEYDWKRLAQSVVPTAKDHNAEEWNDFGRLLLRETAKKLYLMGQPSIQELFNWCTLADPKDLKSFLTGTLAESLFAGSTEASKALSSARFVLSNKLSEHVSMPSGDFSIRDWIENPKAGNLFINWRSDMAPAMRALVTSWVDVFQTAILSTPKGHGQRWWQSLDELAALDALPTLTPALTMGRKHGLRIVASIQATSQLADVYGQLKAQTIRASFRNLVVLGGAVTDPQTAEDMSKALGEHEVERNEYNESRSVGQNSTGSRIVRTRERVVTPSQIQTLPILQGYLAFSGNYPIAPIKIKPLNFLESTPAFVESNLLSPFGLGQGELGDNALEVQPTSAATPTPTPSAPSPVPGAPPSRPPNATLDLFDSATDATP